MSCLHSARCRAEAQIDGSFAMEEERECRTCASTLPPSFFPLQGANCRQCSACTREYDRRRRAAACPPALPAEKQCGRCKQLRPAAAFSADRIHPTGLHGFCRDCSGAVRQENAAVTAAVPMPEAAQPPTRICPDCKLMLPRHAFSRDARISDGHFGRCKSCERALQAKRKAAAAANAAAQPATGG